MKKIRMLQAVQTGDGDWKTRQIDHTALPGEAANWPAVDDTINALIDLGWQVSHETPGNRDGEKTVTLIRPATPDDEDYKLYTALGFDDVPGGGRLDPDDQQRWNDTVRGWM